jgi:hypothetical protein
MSKEAAKRLPEHTPYDHAIDLKQGETPPWGPCYALSGEGLDVLREWPKEMLETGKIRRSKSPAAAPILFVPKAHGRGLRLCVDYRGIDKITIANRYPLPIMSELQDRVRGSRFFTKIDLKLSSHSYKERRRVENRLQLPVWTLRVFSDALWAHKFTSHLPGYDESYPEGFT